MSIKILQQHIADKIAAGEVIERPLSVVKELLENSLDAKASFIEITIKDGGTGLICVKDDGIGMSRDDLAIAFERHATSKIDQFNDLFCLHTFGFRGEALPSIAAVAQVKMTTCQKGAALGHTLSISGGVYGEMAEIGASGGTTVEVKNLFYNIPARRKFLKSAGYEAGLIGDLVSKYALIYPDVRFKLLNGKQTVIDTVGMKTTEERFVYMLGENVKNHLVAVARTEFLPNHFVTAWLVKEEFTRNNRAQEIFFINGRLVKSAELSRTLEESYYTLIAKGRFPLAAVALEIPGEELDINVHPAKLEVKISGFERIHERLLEIFKDALWEASISKNAFLLDDHRLLANASLAQKQKEKEKEKPQSDAIQAQTTSTKTKIAPAAVQKPEPQVAAVEEKPAPHFKAQPVLFDLPNPLNTPLTAQAPVAVFTTASKRETPLPKEEAAEVKGSAPQKAAETMPPEAVSSPKPSAKVKDIDGLTLLGQLNQSFIIAQNSEGLYIIDQHTCHERILYERFMREEDDKTVLVENLLIPATVNVTPTQEAVLINHIVDLRDLGFILESFGQRSYLLRGLPLGLSREENPAQLFLDLLDDLAQSRVVTPAVIKEKIVTTASCKGAIKARWPLTEVEMLTLLHDLSQVDNAHTCPHGRPIIYKLSMSDLYTIFKRGAYTYDH